MSEEKEREGKTRVRGQQLAAAINKGTFSEAIMICFTQPKTFRNISDTIEWSQQQNI